MKTILHITCLILLLPLTLFPCYVGNPAAPAALKLGLFNNTSSYFSLSSCYLYDFQDNKYFTSSSVPQDSQLVDKFSLRSQFGGLTFNLLERLEIFGLFGSSRAEVDWEENPIVPLPQNLFKDGKTDKHFSWMAGARAIFLQWGQVYLGAGFTYFDIPTLKTDSALGEMLRDTIDLAPQYFKLREWQGDIGLSIRLGPLIPYVGGQYLHSRLRIIPSESEETLSYHNQNAFGVFAGLSLTVGKKIIFNVEWRDITEKALSLEASIAF